MFFAASTALAQISSQQDLLGDVKTANDFSIALKIDGTIWSWGLNSNGQLALGNNTNTNISIGDIYLLASALMFASQILTVDHYAEKSDPIMVCLIQFAISTVNIVAMAAKLSLI